MDYYSAHVMARLEHKQRMRFASRVRELDVPTTDSQPRWIRQKVLRLLNLLGTGLIAAGKRMTLEHDIAIRAYHTDSQGQHVAG
jgi:hypothetical protein